jgi:hypothetical protein
MPVPKLLRAIHFTSVTMLSAAFLAGCQPVPISGSATKPSPRPVKPLYDRPVTGTIQDGRKKTGFQVATPDSKPTGTKPTGTKPGTKPAPGAPVDVSQQLLDAADKAASAESLAQFAQTKDDWNQVFDRWKRAIQILKTAPSQTPAIKQKLAEYNSGLAQATRDAQISMNPSLAPVDPIGSRATKTFVGGQAADPKAADPKTAKPTDKPTDKPADKPTEAPTPAPSASPATP